MPAYKFCLLEQLLQLRIVYLCLFLKKTQDFYLEIVRGLIFLENVRLIYRTLFGKCEVLRVEETLSQLIT